MKHFFSFIVIVFIALALLYYRRDESRAGFDDKKIHVYASSSFVAQWGPGPALKELFEKSSIFKVEFVEISDSAMMVQKMIFENEASLADVVMGFDQFDISRHGNKMKWRELDLSSGINFVGVVKPALQTKNFIPYDWAPLSFVTRKSLAVEISQLSHLLKPELQGKIAFQDPRTSSPGLQFLVWVFESFGPEDAVSFLKNSMKQAHSFSPGWSASYGLFKDQQAELVFTYVTSPVYHIVEEADHQYFSIETSEALPVQVEFAAVPASCKNCEAAEMFINFLLTPEAQKILMSKNYMLPVIDQVKEGTQFDALKVYKTLPVQFYDQSRLEKWINTWVELRKNEGL